uniref:Uncharacterized protein n=2 Tax=Caenorhabditis japonica TaxID=281687 RepID=A0A8R1HNG5_CAEJA
MFNDNYRMGDDECEDFGMDTLSLYLPENLLWGDIKINDDYLKLICNEDKQGEVIRRRDCQKAGFRCVTTAMTKALASLRTCHYDIPSRTLVPCKKRTDCHSKDHLRWADVRRFRAACREAQVSEEYNEDTVARFIDNGYKLNR